MSHAWDGAASRAASEFVDATRPKDVWCNTTSCRCEVTWNKGWPVSKNGQPGKTVPRHFKVKRGSDHAAGCPYAVGVQLKLLADLSDPIETSNRPFGRSQGKYRIRLGIIAEAAKRAPIQPTQSSTVSSSFKVGRQYVHTARRAMPYIRSALGVAKLYLALPSSFEREQFKDQVVFDDDGRDVAWRDFLYEPDDYERLYDRLVHSGSNTLDRPISFLVKAATGPQPYTSQGQQRAKFRSERIPIDATASVAVHVYSPIPAVLRRVTRGDTCVVVSLQTWRLPDAVRNGHTLKGIGVMLHYRSQLARL